MSMDTLPTLRSGSNGKAHTVTVGSIALHFSYETIIGFTVNGETVARVNEWGTTTGRHLNEIDSGGPDAKRARLDRPAFAKTLAAAWSEATA